MFANSKYERSLLKSGFKRVAGCDEVGRGCLAGPVVCGCVVFNSNFSLKLIPPDIRVDDSKKLTKLQREISARWIRKNCLTYGLGSGSVAEINKYGIVGATRKAFRRAIVKANYKLITKKKSKIDFLLIDAFYLPYVRSLKMPNKVIRDLNTKNKEGINIKISGKQLAIIHGDEKSVSIAAASIIAKVYRDKLMSKLSNNKRFQKYCWDENKGYGTKSHIEALTRFGPTKMHRNAFIRKIALYNSFVSTTQLYSRINKVEV